MKITDITSLDAYDAFKEASNNLSTYREKKRQLEGKINQCYTSYKAKLKEAEEAGNFKKEEELKTEAKEIKAQLEDTQDELDRFLADSPNYANQQHEAMQELQTGTGIDLINNLREQARAEIDDAVECLDAIHHSKGKFSHNSNGWIPNVDAALSELKSVKERLK